jgi:uncharacterized membrane protein
VSRRGDERGQTTVLIIGFALVAVLLVVVVVDASAAYLRRQRPDTLADGASLAAAQAVDERQVYTHGIDQRLALDPGAARAEVTAYLGELGAYRAYPGLSYRISADADSVQVVVSTPLRLPLVPPGWTRGARVTGAASSLVSVEN